MSVTPMDRSLNEQARFLPPAGPSGNLVRPAIRLPARDGDLDEGPLVFVYWADDGTLRVTVDTEDVQDEELSLEVRVNDGLVVEGTVGLGGLVLQ